MKNLYIIIGLIMLVAVLLVNRDITAPKKLDERVTLKQTDNLPYGMSVARTMLNHLYPSAQIYDSRYHPQWLASNDSGTTVFMIADHLSASENDLQQMLSFISRGNIVFLITRTFSSEAFSLFGIVPSFRQFNQQNRNLQLKLNKAFFADDSLFTYPGFVYTQPIKNYDQEIANILGTDGNGNPNFFELKKGLGKLYIHTAPLAFSNYFILHKKNVRYFEQVMSVLPNPKKIEWNESNLTQVENKKAESGWLSALLQHASFRWSFYLAIAAIVLYLFLGMRRRQRAIPEWTTPKSETMQFVRTLGQLYYERVDHKNLSEKLTARFLTHVRTNFRMSTESLDDEFNRSLANKSGHPEDAIKNISSFINRLPHMQIVSEQQLAGFYQQLTLFYKNTN